jgi:gliding motility-associated-like protein
MFAGTPVIHLKDVNGCQQDLQVTITQPSKLYFASAPVVMPTCEGFKDGVVNVRGKGGTPPYQYSPDKVTYDRQGGYPNLMEGTYSFRVKDSLGCTHDTTITLTGYPHIVVSEPDITPVRCWGERSGKIVLNVTGGFDSLYYLRTLPLPGGRKTINPVFDSLRAGTYHFVITDLKGCRKDTTYVLNQPDSLSINPKVIPNDCIGLDNAGALSTAVTGGNPPYRYVWGWNGGGSDGQTSVGNLPNGVYPLAVVDTKGCADTVTLRVGYDNCCQPFIPTAFTPNNDGTNDTWRALYKGDMTLVTCSIYNRFGQRVFVSANVNDQWDGTYENRPAEMGTYFYYIKVICGNKGDNIVEFQGDITLIR